MPVDDALFIAGTPVPEKEPAKEKEPASDEAAKPADYMVKLLDEKGEVAMEMLSSELVSRVF